VGKGSDDPPIGGTKSARAVRHPLAGERPDQHLQNPRPELADDRLAIFAGQHEARSDNQIGIAVQQSFNEPSYFRRPMLAITVHLYGNFIPVQRCVSIAGLHRAADA